MRNKNRKRGRRGGEDRWDKLYLSIKELREAQRKTDEQIRELREAQRKTDEQMKKTDEQIRELREAQKKTDEQIKKTDEQMKKTNERMDEWIRKFDEMIRRLTKRVEDLTDAEGAFWESLSKEGVKKFLEENGYKIKKISTNVKLLRNGKVVGELDTVFEAEKNNEGHVFICESKATAGISSIDKFIKTLSNIFEHFPEYRGRKIWGVFASGRYKNGTDRYAMRRGLLVFGLSGEVLVLLSDPRRIKPFIS